MVHARWCPGGPYCECSCPDCSTVLGSPSWCSCGRCCGCCKRYFICAARCCARRQPGRQHPHRLIGPVAPLSYQITLF